MRTVRFLCLGAVLVVFAAGGRTRSPNQVAPASALDAPAVFLSWDRFLPSGQQKPYVARFCWGAYGHSGFIDFNALGLYNLGVDVYRKGLHLEAGDVLDLHVHAWQAPVPEALLEIASGTEPLLRARVPSGDSRRLRADRAMLIRIDFQPVPPREEWRFQGAWSLFWKIQHADLPASCRPGGPCGPDTAPCIDRARIRLTAQTTSTGLRLAWTFGAPYDLFEIDMAAPDQPFRSVAWLPGSATRHTLTIPTGGPVYLRVWGHQRWAPPVSSNVVRWPPPTS